MKLTPHFALAIDAAATTATALLMLAARSMLYPYFGLQSPLFLDITAVAFLAYAGIIAMAARRPMISRRVLMTTAAANAAYVVASIVALLLFWSQLEPIGRGLVFVVALAVEAFATLQLAVARRVTARLTQPA
jgi:asparagine N-glycosylation enzyme membrane subunit Stt3